MLLTFTFSMIVLLLNFVWLYIDDFVGKGLEFAVITELFSYLSIRLIPMALGLAVLVASVMSFGHLGEHRELTAMRASGLANGRLYMPVLVLLVFISLSSVFLADRVIPVTNFKFRSLLSDIQQKQPVVMIPQGSFYNGLEGFSIRIGEKENRGNNIKDVMIYDHRNPKEDRTIVAQSGQLDVFGNEAYLRFTLENGSSYTELNTSRDNKSTTEFRRDYFDRQELTIEMPSSDLERRSNSGLSSLYTMLSNRQLRDTSYALEDEEKWRGQLLARDLLKQLIPAPPVQRNNPLIHQSTNPPDHRSTTGVNRDATAMARMAQQKIRDFAEWKTEHSRWTNRFKIERHLRWSYGLGCILFFLIGAPLGALFRRGGLGTPVVISTLVYLTYHMLTIAGTKLAREGDLSIQLGVWAPVFVLLLAFVIGKRFVHR